MFEKCVKCQRLGRDCSPNFYIMPIEEMVVFVKQLMTAKGWKNSDLAEASGVKEGTIKNFLTGKRDIMYSNITAMLFALVGGADEESPCPSEWYDAEKHKVEIIKLENENAELKAKSTEDTQYLKKAIKVKNTAIVILGTALFIALVVIILALMIDKYDSGRGFFWLSRFG